ncbi:ribosomal protein S7 domain-containing protein [Trametes punicea]|nr:ribosomal protein S7 domain-containing protein [Trametes punicea]
MLSSIRHAVARLSLRRATTVRTLTDSAVSDAVSAGEPSLLSTLSSSQPPAAASTSSIASTSQRSPQPAMYIPPAEDPLLHLFTSCIMKHGKRQAAAARTAKMLQHIHGFTKAPPLPIFRQAIFTVAPLLRCRQFKRAAKHDRLDSGGGEKKGGKKSPERFAREIIAVIKGESDALKTKLEWHKLAVLHRGNVLRPPRVPKSNRG